MLASVPMWFPDADELRFVVGTVAVPEAVDELTESIIGILKRRAAKFDKLANLRLLTRESWIMFSLLLMPDAGIPELAEACNMSKERVRQVLTILGGRGVVVRTKVNGKIKYTTRLNRLNTHPDIILLQNAYTHLPITAPNTPPDITPKQP